MTLSIFRAFKEFCWRSKIFTTFYRGFSFETIIFQALFTLFDNWFSIFGLETCILSWCKDWNGAKKYLRHKQFNTLILLSKVAVKLRPFDNFIRLASVIFDLLSIINYPILRRKQSFFDDRLISFKMSSFKVELLPILSQIKNNIFVNLFSWFGNYASEMVCSDLMNGLLNSFYNLYQGQRAENMKKHAQNCLYVFRIFQNCSLLWHGKTTKNSSKARALFWADCTYFVLLRVSINKTHTYEILNKMLQQYRKLLHVNDFLFIFSFNLLLAKQKKTSKASKCKLRMHFRHFFFLKVSSHRIVDTRKKCFTVLKSWEGKISCLLWMFCRGCTFLFALCRLSSYF